MNPGDFQMDFDELDPEEQEEITSGKIRRARYIRVCLSCNSELSPEDTKCPYCDSEELDWVKEY